MSRAPIVCVGFADWDADVWTNQQHLMSRLAADRTVLFVESLGLRRPQLSAGRDLRRMVRRLVRGLSGPRQHDGVHVLAPLVLPWHSGRLAPALNRVLLRRLVERATAQLEMDDPVLWSYVPQAAALVAPLRPRAVVYHCVDDIAAQKGVDPEAFRRLEREFVATADVVLASAPPLVERLAPIGTPVVHLPNVADTDLFATALDPGVVDPAIEALPAPRLIFVGAVVATKLDVELIAELGRRRPSWSIALVGPAGLGDPSTDLGALVSTPNVQLLGARPHRDLPEVLRGADVALIPYARNDLTASISPMKTHEYLAAGLPVVATPLPSMLGVPDVEIAADVDATVRAVEKALESDTPRARQARSRRARGHSWSARVREIDGVLDELDERSAGRTVVAVASTPTRDGGRGLRTCGLITALARRGPVDVVFQRNVGDVDPDPLPGVSWHPVEVSRGPRRFMAYASARVAGVPRGFARAIWPELATRVESLDDGRCRILADGPSAASALRALARRRPVSYIAHNLESALRPQINDPDAGPRPLLQHFERRLLRRSHESWMVSTSDIDGAQLLAPGAALRRVPNVVDLPPEREAPGEATAVFVGDARYEPNRRALRLLVDEVAPVLAGIRPGARIMLVGRGTDSSEFAGAPGVYRRGYVGTAELAAIYREAGCAVVPLREGSGSPLKFVEALAHGLPVVATSVAATGVDGAHPGEHFLLADPTGEGIARAIIAALDPTTGARLGAAARTLARAEYSVDALERVLAW